MTDNIWKPEFEILVKRIVEETLWISIRGKNLKDAERRALKKINNDDEFFYQHEDSIRIHEPYDWEIDRSFCCLDCGIDTLRNKEYPLMLKNEIWEQIVPGGNGMLCQSCIEKRLGRTLTPDDKMVI